MSQEKSLTLEGLYEIFAENDRKVKESRIETDRKIRESSAKTDREIRKSSAETDRKIQEMTQQIKELSAETERKRQEIDLRMDQRYAEMDKQLDKLLQSAREHGSYINNASERMEQYFIQAINNNNCQIGDVIFDEIQANTERHNKQDGVEIDGLLLNGEYVGILEVKTTLHLNDLEKVVAKIPRFRKHFKEYKDKKLLVYVAGEVVHNDAINQAHELGFSILTPDGQKIKLDNSHAKHF